MIGGRSALLAATGNLPSGPVQFLELSLSMQGANNGTSFPDDSATVKGFGTAKTISSRTAVTSTTQSKFYSSSGRFNNTYLTVADNAGLDLEGSDFTLEFWAYSLSLSNAIVFSKYVPFQIYLNTNWAVYAGSTSNVLQFPDHDILSGFAGGPGLLNQWQHFALTRSGNTWRIFLNGIISNTTTAAGSILPILDEAAIGGFGSPTPNSFFYNGYIQNLRLYKGIALYTTSNFSPTTDAYP